MTQAKGTPPERFCSQHHQDRSECDPEWETHAQPLRCSDSLIARVAAKAASLGLDSRNAGLIAALEAWAPSRSGSRTGRECEHAR